MIIGAPRVDDGEIGGESLREYRRYRRAVRAHAEDADEREVADDVEHAGDRDEHQRRGRVAEAAEDRRERVVGEHRREPRDVDEDVAASRLERLFRRAEQPHYRVDEQEQPDRYDDAQQSEERQHSPDGVVYLLRASRAEEAPDHYRAAYRKPDDDAVYHEDELAPDGDGRKARRVGELSDDYHVGGAVERLQQVRRHVGNREAREEQRDAALRQRLRAGREDAGEKFLKICHSALPHESFLVFQSSQKII